MGFRLYLTATPNEVVDRINGAEDVNAASLAAFAKDAGVDGIGDDKITYVSVSGLTREYPTYELGKEYDLFSKLIKEEDNHPTLKWFADEDTYCYVGDASMLTCTMCHYKDKVIALETKLASGEMSEEDRGFHYRSKLNWLNSEHLFKLDPDNFEVTGVWLYEYSMFNLVSFYKSIDWSIHKVLLIGY